MKEFFTTLFLVFGLCCGAIAQDKEPFNEQRFNALKASGAVILVDVYAPWCPTCAKQQEAISQYRAENPEKNFHTLIVDFDNDKQWVRYFRAPRQSTLILYAGEEQVWFNVAETRLDVIGKQLDMAIAKAGQDS